MEITTKRCPFCKEEIQSDATKCRYCGEYLPQDNYMQPSARKPLPPNNYLVWAILVTIFCCLPFGIVSIVYSSKVDSNYAAGYYDEAERYSRQARNWMLAALITGAVAYLAWLLLTVLGVFTAIGSGLYWL